MLVSPATLLYRLQSIDQAMSQRRLRLKDIQGALKHNDAVQTAQKQVDDATQTLKPWQVRTRDLDLEIKGLTSRIQAAETSLYSGKVTLPKALQELQAEIAALKRSQARLEDQMLEAMMHAEEGQNALEAAQKALSEAQTLYAGLQGMLITEKERLEQELQQLDGQRKQAATGIEAAALATYDALRPKKHGSAVALLQNGSCSVCQIEQTSNLIHKVQQESALITCASCGRILAPRG